jgi:hypothetical protein
MKLKVTHTDGTITEYPITPALEVAFELYAKKGFHRAFREDEMQSHVYWLVWEAKRRAQESPAPFNGDAFLSTLAKVEVTDDDVPLN